MGRQTIGVPGRPTDVIQASLPGALKRRRASTNGHGGDPGGRSSAVAATLAAHREIELMSGHSLALRLWDGTELGPPASPYRVILRQPWSLRAFLLPPSDLTAGEAYVNGAVDVEGAMLEAARAGGALAGSPLSWAQRSRLLRCLLQLPRPPHRSTGRRAALAGPLHSKERDRSAIAFHYDLPQAFYEQFLDRSLVYSCAYFADASEELEAAQTRKLDLICRKLRLSPGMTMLDVGCGWGSLLAHAARRYGVRGVGVTLSETQSEAGRERLREAGLADEVEILLADYRDVSGSFDAVVSVGMFEHIGPDHLSEYFSTVRRLTAAGGLFLNHGIVTGRPDEVRSLTPGRGQTFAGTYVFPDGGAVPAWRAVRELEYGGFELLDVEQLRPHYAITAGRWLQRLERNHDAAARASSEADYRIWRTYLAASAVSFENASLGVIQMLGSAGASVPLGRSWMIPAEEEATLHDGDRVCDQPSSVFPLRSSATELMQ